MDITSNLSSSFTAVNALQGLEIDDYEATKEESLEDVLEEEEREDVRLISSFDYLTQPADYMKNIRNFRMSQRRTSLDLGLSWDELRIADLTPAQLIMNAHSERVRMCFMDVINNLRVVGYYFHLLSRSPETLEKVVHAWATYCRLKMRMTEKEPKNPKHLRLNPLQSIYIRIKHCKSMVQHATKMKDSKFSPFMRKLMESLKNLLGVMGDTLKLSADESVRRTAWLRRLNIAHKQHEAANSIKMEQIQRMSEGATMIAEKDCVINGIRDKIEQIRSNHKERIRDMMLKSELEMANLITASDDRQKHLVEDANDALANYEILVAKHLREEKQIKAKRGKIEVQLSAMIFRYDKDMGERQDDLDEIQQELDNRGASLRELEYAFELQDELYQQYAEQKADEEVAKFRAKLREFKANRAARIIQKAWRLYRYKKILRRKAAKDRKEAKKAKEEARAQK